MKHVTQKSFVLYREDVQKLVNAGVKNPVLDAFLGRDKSHVAALG